jgi:hypothetical protein
MINDEHKNVLDDSYFQLKRLFTIIESRQSCIAESPVGEEQLSDDGFAPFICSRYR